MGRSFRRAGRDYRKFCRDTEGSATVEFVIWVPVFMAIILLAADVSLIFMRQSNFWTVSQETARIVARHGMDEASAEEYAKSQIVIGSYVPDVQVRIENDVVSVTITGATDEIVPFGQLHFALGDQITAHVTQSLEPL